MTIAQPVAFGAAHIPTRYSGLDTTLSFSYRPVASTLVFRHVSFRGAEPRLDITNLSGTLANGTRGWEFHDFKVRTTSSAFTLNGAVGGGHGINLEVRAERFAFQEWAGIVHGLTHIGVNARFDVTLRGPEERLATTIDLSGTGGSVKGQLVLNTAVPGWHGAGEVNVARLDLARWLDKPDRPSDITGRVGFDLDLDLGGHFPRGRYRFDGPHAAFMDYGADNVRARGVLTATEAKIAAATATAYGAGVSLVDGSAITLNEPYPFRFVGRVDGIDLRRLPASVPVPHVESRMTFNYDVAGRFSEAFIAGRADFDRSEFLGAELAAGTSGTIDTSSVPLRYSGEGDVQRIDVNRIGAGLDIEWMQDPRYAGDIAGHFRVAGTGSDRESMTLEASGRIARAVLFHGAVDDADVALTIAAGSLTTSFNGRFSQIDPAVALADPRFTAVLSGTADVKTTVKDLLVRTPTLHDYDIDGTLALDGSKVRGFPINRLTASAALRDGTLRVASLEASGPALTGSGTGVVSLSGDAGTLFDYTVARADLSQFPDIAARGVAGIVFTKGRASGPYSALRFVGSASAAPLKAPNASAATSILAYDVTLPSGQIDAATGRLDASASVLTAFGQNIDRATAIVTLTAARVGLDVDIRRSGGRGAKLLGDIALHLPEQRADLVNLTVTLGQTPWQLARNDADTPSIRWSGDGVDVDLLQFVAGASRDERIQVGGSWRRSGGATLRLEARHVFLETLAGVLEGPALYGGTLDLDASVTGTTTQPVVAARFKIANGRVRRVPYQALEGRVDYANDLATIDVRLDQAPGVWLTARGGVPRSLVDAAAPDLPMDVAIASSAINLGLLEGVTNVVRNVNGTLNVDVTAIGTGRDPHLRGSVGLAGASFLVVATGVRYANARATIRLARDRIDVQTLHVEDTTGRPLDLHGSLATHELRVAGLAIDGTARHFQVLRNEFGKVDIDADIQLRGQFEAPRIAGAITINGGDVQVDTILERALFQPYATESIAVPADVDPVAALNPWERLGLDLELHVPNTLKLVGNNVQVSPGTPVGLGNINLRVAGDLYLYKDPGQQLFVTGSFDSLSGTYNFQGRQFNVDPSSSINFRGDLSPELFVSVTREISGVEARVTINGSLRAPELRLSSTPPLDSSDILSLIVFNTTPNQLSTAQQQELAVRAGTLAAGFIATPIVSALRSEIAWRCYVHIYSLSVLFGEGKLESHHRLNRAETSILGNEADND